MRRTNDDKDQLDGGRRSSVIRHGTRKDRERYDSYLKRKGTYHHEKSCLQRQIRSIGPRQPKNRTKGSISCLNVLRNEYLPSGARYTAWKL